MCCSVNIQNILIESKNILRQRRLSDFVLEQLLAVLQEWGGELDNVQG